MTTAVFASGFAAGLVKAAASGDNQPGPTPGSPSPPDSHRPRNVALGAAVLAGGLLGGRHVAGAIRGQAQMASSLATKAIQQRRAGQGAAILGAMKSSNPAVAGKARNVARKWQLANKLPINPTAGEKVKALAGHYKGKVQGAINQARTDHVRGALQNARDADHAKFLGEHGMSAPAAAKKKGGLGRRVAAAGAGAALLGGAAVAGASGASKAREPQSNDQPGLG